MSTTPPLDLCSSGCSTTLFSVNFDSDIWAKGETTIPFSVQKWVRQADAAGMVFDPFPFEKKRVDRFREIPLSTSSVRRPLS